MDVTKKTQEVTDTKQRSIGLDLLRIIASLMIVVQHVSAYGLEGFPVGTMEWRASNFYCAGVRWAYPIFFVMSGHLFLNRDKKFSVSEIFRKNMAKLIVIYFVWLMIYAYASMRAEINGMDVMSAVHVIATNALNNGKYHLWFLPSIIGCYLLLPVFHALAEYKEGKYLKCVCIMFFVLGIIRSTIFPFQDNLLSLAVWKIEFWLSGYMGYFLVGCYLGRLDVTKYRMRNMSGIFAVTLAGHILACDRLGVRNGLLYGNFCILSFIEVVMLFLIARKLSELTMPKLCKRMIAVLAEGTLGVYLIHIYVLENMEWINIGSFTQWLSIPIRSFLIFAISMCMSIVLRRIPFVGKWIV